MSSTCVRRPRSLLVLVSLLAGACGGGGGGGGDGIDPDPVAHDVAAGDVDSTSVVLWARSAATGPVTFEVATDAGFTSVVAVAPGVVTDPGIPAKADVGGLAPGTTYHYRATTPSGVLSPGTFRTAVAPGTSAGLHFGVGGDWRQDMLPYPAIQNAADLGLDFFVALGDTIYADFASPDVPVAQATTLAEFRAKHDEAYGVRAGINTIGDLRDSTALFVTIDDHEVIDDFAGGAHPSTDPRFSFTTESYVNDTPLFETGMQAYVEWNPVRDELYAGTGDDRMEGEKKLYRFRRFGDDAAVIVLDTRSFRDDMLDDPDPTDPGSVDAFDDASFDPTRTMLGEAQLEDLFADLLAAEAEGITWKFVMIPEPIQNLGPAAPADRYEGYAFERSRILEFIDLAGLTNVVFVTADIHGTVVNNLQYQPLSPDDPQVDVASWEISVPAVAFDPALGEAAVDAGDVTILERAIYDSADMDGKDELFQEAFDEFLEGFGYDPTGLEGSEIPATLVEGRYVRAHAFGWVEFQIDPVTQVLTVTVWGIEPYEPGDEVGDEPFVLTRFTVDPVGVLP
jgi:phosphodiesterase/alkaline phosphatase D-like protein